MKINTPKFWFENKSIIQIILSPLALIWLSVSWLIKKNIYTSLRFLCYEIAEKSRLVCYRLYRILHHPYAAGGSFSLGFSHLSHSARPLDLYGLAHFTRPLENGKGV